MSENPVIEIVVNGEGYRIVSGAKIPDLVRELALTPERLAIELNRDILPRGRWAETTLQPGDALEIVHFVGGG
ncbi:MAG: sulfur carrier protein ThiS [Blastocatellia bacterium]|nr:sulfur carrier protein ThiS [Blastocatellia bacterium]